ncbi:MAG: SAM-dependent methyltransferase, partial [Candidatus Dadabacteria bacterium]
LSLTAVSNLFRRHGLTVFDVEQLSTHGGSLRVWAQRADTGTRTEGDVVAAILREEEDAGITTASGLSDFAAQVRRIKFDSLRFLIERAEAGDTIAGYGAAAKGNTFLNYCGIGPELISFVVDRNPEKQGRFLPGSRIPVYSPEKIEDVRPDWVVILPWNLRDEISAQLAQIRDWGGKFVTFIPETNIF